MGAGVINIIKDIGLDTPYNGISPLIKGDIAYDTAYYLTKSEQIPSALLIGFSMDDNLEVTASGGILIQTFPETQDESVEYAEKSINALSSSFSGRIQNGETPLSILLSIFGKEESEILSSCRVTYSCRCSRDLLRNTLKMIDKKDLIEILENDNSCEMTCSFCEKKYNFGHDELKEIIENI